MDEESQKNLFGENKPKRKKPIVEGKIPPGLLDDEEELPPNHSPSRGGFKGRINLDKVFPEKPPEE